ncbi:phage portal protein [Dongia sp.]|uniref:phage portal protein n=1 Tax=Dongia sp. TaxID=1977262 RepID=UPI0035B3FE79
MPNWRLSARWVLPTTIGVARGEPWLARGLIKLHDCDIYDDAEMQRRQSAALNSGVITTPGAADDGEVVAGIMGADQPEEVVISKMSPSGMSVLPPGYNIEFMNPAEVGGSYEAFQRQQLSAAAVSVGMSYEALTGDRRGTNDRIYRADVLGFTRLVTMWQYHMVVFTMCRAIWRRFVDLAIASGKWTPPKGVKRRDYMRVTWRPRLAAIFIRSRMLKPTRRLLRRALPRVVKSRRRWARPPRRPIWSMLAR